MGDGMLSLSWNNHKATFCHILANLRDKERYTDVTLACEGKFYRVHKLVLSTCSEYFEGMFENTPCKHPVIVLNQIKHDEIEALLSYMYAGVVNVAQSDLARLIKAAELLKIKGLAVPDEPPQESDVRKNQPSSWGSRDERTSPSPKRRRRDDGTPHGGSQTSNSPASSPRASPYMDNSDYGEKSRTQSEGLSSEQRGDKTDNRGDPLSTNLDDNDKSSRRTSNEESQPPMIMVDESLVKEEIVDNPDDSRENVLDSGLDFGSLGADKLDASSDGSNSVLPNKFDNPLMPSQSQLPDPVVETLAGPSGMQGWLGDMGGGFPTVDNFRGEGSQQDVRQPLPGQQQPLPMAVAKDVIQVGPVGTVIHLRKDVPFGIPHDFVQVGLVEGLPPDGTLKLVIPEKPPLKANVITKVKKPAPLLMVKQQPPPIQGALTRPDQKPKILGRKPGAYGNYKKKLKNKTPTADPKKFSCTYCSYVTVTSTNLLNHMRTHTGEKPFACDYCPYRSTQKGNLRSHINKHHQDCENSSNIKIVDVQGGMTHPWHSPVQDGMNSDDGSSVQDGVP